MTRKEVIWLRGVPLVVLAAALCAAFAIEVTRRGVPDLGISVVVAVGFVGVSLQSGVRYIRRPAADFSRNEALARAFFDLAFSAFIVVYSLR